METIKQVDELGRVVLPKKWRDRHQARRVVVREVGDSLEITPLRIRPINDFFDSITVDVPPAVFRNPHELKRALRKSP